VPAGYRGELLPAWAGTQAFREEEAIPLFYLGGAMRSFLYRWAIRFKDFGERHGCRALIKLGLAMRNRL
jgi:hypothetical protein